MSVCDMEMEKLLSSQLLNKQMDPTRVAALASKPGSQNSNSIYGLNWTSYTDQ